MDEIITTTKSKLIKAIMAWNKDVLDNPSGYEANDYSEDCAIQQADELIRYLNEV